MPILTIDIPQQLLARVRAAYQRTFALDAPPDEEFIRQHLITTLQSVVRNAEADAAIENARRNIPDLPIP